MNLWNYRGIHFLHLKFYIQDIYPFFQGRDLKFHWNKWKSHDILWKKKKKKKGKRNVSTSKYQKYQFELTKYNLTCSILYFFSFTFLYLTPYADVQFHWCTYHCTLGVSIMFKHVDLVGFNLAMQTLTQKSPNALMPLLTYLNLDLNT